MAGSCEHGNESWGNMKGRELVDQLFDYIVFSRSAVLRGVNIQLPQYGNAFGSNRGSVRLEANSIIKI
jgi:hypothetical protein